MKVKVDKVEYDIKSISLAERCELNDLVIERADKPSFSLGTKCIDSVNKKKDKR